MGQRVVLSSGMVGKGATQTANGKQRGEKGSEAAERTAEGEGGLTASKVFTAAACEPNQALPCQIRPCCQPTLQVSAL